jgi:4-aminobutyrate aminotransferase
MSLSASKLVHRTKFGPLVPHVHHVPFPRDHQNCQLPNKCDCIEVINQTVFKRTAAPDETAAIFVEPIQGEGGYYAASPAFLQALRKLCDQHGILLIADEIQSGMGRTGKLFAIEYAGVEPDILCIAKGIASGLPLGAIIAKTAIMNWPSGSHASTFGGNPVACRAALTTLDLLEKEYLANARTRGEELRMGLKQLAAKHARIMGEVRAIGLMIAVDVHSNGKPDTPLRNKLEDLCYERGLLILGCGDSSLRICPPLCINSPQIHTALRILDEVLSQKSN